MLKILRRDWSLYCHSSNSNNSLRRVKSEMQINFTSLNDRCGGDISGRVIYFRIMATVLNMTQVVGSLLRIHWAPVAANNRSILTNALDQCWSWRINNLHGALGLALRPRRSGAPAPEPATHHLRRLVVTGTPRRLLYSLAHLASRPRPRDITLSLIT